MSRLTSLVKSGKRKITKMKTGQPTSERERDDIKARQKLPESAGPSASKRGFLGRPDPSASREFLGRPDPSTSREFLGRPDPEVSEDATNLQ